MGTVTATMEVGDPQGRNFQEVNLEVDTGSTFTALPRELLQALGVPVSRTEQSRLADGSRQPVELGDTAVRLAGKEFMTTVIFAEEGEPSLLGVVTLEQALLAVDPVNNELIPVEAKRYWTGLALEQVRLTGIA
ncbi:MAG: aspartyl protease family protein [Chloroflexota bacterium]|nr:aspartyl protease family protein [Chloroflexota bacterium]MDE2841779.1 aspartyl protease family protein [Chloroflexota bacterium]